MHRHSLKTVAIPPKMSILFIAQYTYTPPPHTKLTHSQKVIISFIPRCFSHHFLFSVAWHRFRHLLILSNTKTFWWIFVNTLSAPSCYVKTIRIQNFRCVFFHLSMVFFSFQFCIYCCRSLFICSDALCILHISRAWKGPKRQLWKQTMHKMFNENAILPYYLHKAGTNEHLVEKKKPGKSNVQCDGFQECIRLLAINVLYFMRSI